MNKDKPTEEWIGHIRRRFPCETEFDRILTKKLKTRDAGPFVPVSLEDLRSRTENLLRRELLEPFKIRDARWLAGGASKLQMGFVLEWNRPGIGPSVTPMVLRMEPAAAISETSRRREFQLIAALEGHIPVPPAYWMDPDAEFLPYPAIIYGFAEGVTKPTLSSSQVSGVGTFMPPAVRQPLGSQFVHYLAKTHTFDWSTADLSAFDKPEAGTTQALEWHLNHWERVVVEDIREDVPLLSLAMNWLRSNMPVVDHVSVVHGDYRVGNFLFTEEDLKISAWLDWELGYLGDRHDDLSWAMQPIFGHMAEDGKTFLVGGFMPAGEFVENYERAAGLSVVPATLRYYDILNLYKTIAITLASGCRVTRHGKTHQDVLVGWLTGIGYPLLEQLRAKLEEVL